MDVTGDHIREWHLSPKPEGRGWSRVGYSDLIKRNGHIEQLQDYDEDAWVESNEITNGAKGFNGVSRHICLAGGLDLNGECYFGEFYNFYTDAQFVSLQDYVKRFLGVHPDCQVLGHYQVNNDKVCPGFPVDRFLKFIQIPDRYIFKND
jgi:N-acetyl-anhydromuramyl-L-alanine amidase AmpD